MSNMDLQVLSAEQQRFIDDTTALMTPWGMPPSMASLYACLLIVAEPQDLDTLAARLGMAKSSASVAARTLEHYGLARRHTERGSKRLRFSASDRFAGYILSQAALMGDFGRLIETRAAKVAEPGALRRLRYLGAFQRKMEAAIVDRVRELADEFARFGPDEDLK
jgi:DNA-binding transcriptional regulator GbsR (MarR family)